jgi:hypothetical protein
MLALAYGSALRREELCSRRRPQPQRRTPTIRSSSRTTVDTRHATGACEKTSGGCLIRPNADSRRLKWATDTDSEAFLIRRSKA